MIQAALWSALATATLLVGMLLAYRGLVGERWTGLLMAFGAGAISNVPQGLGGSAGMLKTGWEKPRITQLWIAVCALRILAAVVGCGAASLVPAATGAAMDAFAAGALLAMLTDSMIPESFEEGGREAGLALVVGFGIATAMVLAQAG